MSGIMLVSFPDLRTVRYTQALYWNETSIMYTLKMVKLVSVFDLALHLKLYSFLNEQRWVTSSSSTPWLRAWLRV